MKYRHRRHTVWVAHRDELSRVRYLVIAGRGIAAHPLSLCVTGVCPRDGPSQPTGYPDTSLRGTADEESGTSGRKSGKCNSQDGTGMLIKCCVCVVGTGSPTKS